MKDLMSLREMDLRYGPGMVLIVQHWPTRKILNFVMPIPESGDAFDVYGEKHNADIRDYVYMGVI
jgi:hypothetical protein